jgi:glycosyltransferase involved in cell wall biosynthesis
MINETLIRPLISVIMPVYNSESYLYLAITSILRQSFVNFEFIIIDDCSTDMSRDIIRSFDDPRIRLIENPKNFGYLYGLNLGIEISKGEFIARMDSDDIAYPNRFEEQIKVMLGNVDVGVCGSFVRFIGNKKGIWKPPVFSDQIKAGMINGSPFCHPVVMIRKEILLICNLRYDDDFYTAEDYYLWYQLASRTSFYNIPKVLLDYRISETQISSRCHDIQLKLKQSIRMAVLLPLGILKSDQLQLLLSNCLCVEETFIYLDKLSSSNVITNSYDQQSFDRELSMILLNSLPNSRLNVKFIKVLIFSRFFKFYSLRMKLGLLKRFLT